MKPNAIVVLSGGSVADKDPQTGATVYRSTTYDEGDAFGTLGGIARVQAAAEIAKKYPSAFIVTTGMEGPDGRSHASIQAAELEGLGVAPERIVREELSVNTRTQIEESLRIAESRGWGEVIFVGNRYQMRRVQAFVEHMTERPKCNVGYQDAESVLIEADPNFAEEFSRIEQTEPYERRVAAEARGVAAIESGNYSSTPKEDKKERSM